MQNSIIHLLYHWSMRTLTVVVCLLLLTPTLAWAYERPNAVSLSGDWDFVAVEPMMDLGRDRDARPDWPTLSPEWDEVIDPERTPPWDADWQPVQVPCAWEQYAGTGYNGAGWYARYLDIPREWCGDGRRSGSKTSSSAPTSATTAAGASS